MQINWPLVGMVLKTGVAEGKEIDMQGTAACNEGDPCYEQA
mgnify:CR=1 FL=1